MQAMLAYLKANPCTYVIVHKVDRLARNRVDDVAITLAIQNSGAQLVSVTENIDETPSGALLHGIMSSIAEFYSRNLAGEVIKGTQQKVLEGGTPALAPLGYLNVREVISGRESRTISIDHERAQHITWAFDAYASGNWSIPKLAAELQTRGLTQRPTAKRAARPITVSSLHNILRNRYYIGIVTWRGIEYPGKHLPITDTATFERAQEVLDSHRRSGERSYRRKHHLAGSLCCARCGSKLIYAISTGKLGVRYPYWLCLGRHKAKNGCDLPYLAESNVESAVVDLWHRQTLPTAALAVIRSGLQADLTTHTSHAESERRRLAARVNAVKHERLKWAELAMDGSVPRDIARDKQSVLSKQLDQLEGHLAVFDQSSVDMSAAIVAVTSLLSRCGAAYEAASGPIRRDYNQAWFERINLNVDEFEVVHTEADATDFIEALRTSSADENRAVDRGEDDLGLRMTSVVKGSNVTSMVGAEGFEPPTAGV